MNDSRKLMKPARKAMKIRVASSFGMALVYMVIKPASGSLLPLISGSCSGWSFSMRMPASITKE